MHLYIPRHWTLLPHFLIGQDGNGITRVRLAPAHPGYPGRAEAINGGHVMGHLSLINGTAPVAGSSGSTKEMRARGPYDPCRVGCVLAILVAAHIQHTLAALAF
jgi:hypothetical protein